VLAEVFLWLLLLLKGGGEIMTEEKITGKTMISITDKGRIAILQHEVAFLRRYLNIQGISIILLAASAIYLALK